jgi:nicotinate-nucleotide adenylyltransferase
MERRTSLIGVYGGTFDPIHLGHIHVIQSLLKTGLFTKILIVPAKHNPLKAKPSAVSDELRLQLLNASIKELSDPRIEIWEGELQREGLSYMKDTLIELSQKKLGELALILGNEVFNEFPNWKEPKTVLSLANLVIVQRTPAPLTLNETLKKCGVLDGESRGTELFYLENSKWIKVFQINALPYSSTEIRKSLAKAWNTNSLSKTPQGIQRSVWLLIKENQLYAVN